VLTDIFGTRFAATNYGILYCDKGIAAYTGSWRSVFMAAAVMSALTAIGALELVKPMRLARARANHVDMPPLVVGAE
jgi:OFA family oxalate/formate antiporter-like MFS transporter